MLDVHKFVKFMLNSRSLYLYIEVAKEAAGRCPVNSFFRVVLPLTMFDMCWILKPSASIYLSTWLSLYSYATVCWFWFHFCFFSRWIDFYLSLVTLQSLATVSLNLLPFFCANLSMLLSWIYKIKKINFYDKAYSY